jgi:hypothetical protein
MKRLFNKITELIVMYYFSAGVAALQEAVRKI